MKINFFNTTVTEEAINLAVDTLKSEMLSAGKKADKFEQLLAEKGLIRPITVNSGTVTMHLALEAAGVGEGDEVILPAQTFIATGMAVLYVRAKPVFCDINPRTGNIDIEDLKNKLTARTKAIIPVHWAGYPCDLDEINTVAATHNIAVIEDAAHAFGATYKNNPIGSISRFTSFSFQAIKHLTTGDGGALCCKEEQDAYNVRRWRWFDIDRENAKPSILGEREYDANHIGYKYHMNDLAASIGIGNLLTFEKKLNRTQEIAKQYTQELQNIPGLSLMEYTSDRTSAYWLFPVLVEDRISFITKMQESHIPVSVVHLGIDKNSIFGGLDQSLSNQRYFDNHQIHIPIHNGLTDEQTGYIIDTIKKGW